MKYYKRLTERDEFGNADIIGLDSHELASGLHFDELNKLTSALNRFADLEDKIERGELVEVPKGAVVLTPEERSEEMRLTNEERKQAVKEFAVRLKKKADPYNYDENYINRSVMYTDIDDLVTEVCGE